MRIFFLADVFPSVSETFVLAQVTGLIDRGHEVHIFAAARPAPGQRFPEDVERYRLMDRVTYHHDRPRSWGQRLAGLPGLLQTGTREHRKILWRALNFFRYGREALSLNLVYQTALFLKAYPVDIWQCHFGQNGVLGVLLKELGLGGRVVTMFHGYDIRAGLKDSGKCYRSLVTGGDAALAICRYNRTRLLEWGFPLEKVVDLSVGVDISRFVPSGHGQKGDKIRLVMVARLVPEKAVFLALEAVAGLKNRAVVLDIAGDGPLRGVLEARAMELGMADRVVFHGACTPAEVAELLAHGDIFLLTSDAEALPVVIMEAMAAGLPVVATDVGGVRELVEEGRSGCVVPPGNSLAVQDALKKLIADESLRQDWGREGRRIVQERFDNAVLIARLEAIYDELIGVS